MSQIFNCFRKIYIFFIVPTYENKSIQTDIKREYNYKSCQTQTQTLTETSSTRYINSCAQTDIKLTDICNDNEWSNLTWIKADLIDMV